ncbi:MAG TPA: hypothetical protein VFF03_00920 [Rhodocyclaceae bacterium]|nr:hypothetical protein [Rhodocyclaceae bacterium]
MTDSADDALQDEEESGSADPWMAERDAHAAMVMAVSQSAMAVEEQARALAESAMGTLALMESPLPPVVPEETVDSTEAEPEPAPPESSPD